MAENGTRNVLRNLIAEALQNARADRQRSRPRGFSRAPRGLASLILISLILKAFLLVMLSMTLGALLTIAADPIWLHALRRALVHMLH